MRKPSFFSFCSVAGLLLVVAGCVEPYVPAVLDAPTSFLVVDGFINGNGRTRIKLSRTANLATPTAPPVEKGATIFILDDTGVRYSLREQTAGAYQSDSLILPTGRQYRLIITTTSKAAYASALVPLKVTPPIDKLNWQLSGPNLNLTLSTHDPQQQSRYYRWRLVETWQFNAAYQSFLEYDRKLNDVVKRTTPIYTCWRTEAPTTIRQGTSAQLSQDALTDVPLLSFATLTERFKVRYSLLVTQYAETADEFAYLELLRKNTEAVGTVNDPLPTQLTGNVRRTDANANEPVLGFVSAHTVQQKRLFIDRSDLPPANGYDFATPYADCAIGLNYFCDTYKHCDRQGIVNSFSFSGNVPIDNITDAILGDGFSGASAYCADCRTRGSNVKPSFW